MIHRRISSSLRRVLASWSCGLALATALALAPALPAAAQADPLQAAEDAAALALRFAAAIDAGDDAAAQAMYLPPPSRLPLSTAQVAAMNESARQQLQKMEQESAGQHRALMAKAYEREVSKRRARAVTGQPRVSGLEADGKGTDAYRVSLESDTQTAAPNSWGGAKTTLLTVTISRDGTGKLGIQSVSTEY